MSEIKGSLVNMKVRVNGSGAAMKTLVCTEDSTFEITNEVSKRRTNCGLVTNLAEAEFTASGNAVQNVEPGGSEVSYKDVKAWQVARTLLDFNYVSEADAALSFVEGEAVDNYGSGYFTSSSYDASAEADGVGSFAWTFEGTGTLDDYES